MKYVLHYKIVYRLYGVSGVRLTHVRRLGRSAFQQTTRTIIWSGGLLNARL